MRDWFGFAIVNPCHPFRCHQVQQQFWARLPTSTSSVTTYLSISRNNHASFRQLFLNCRFSLARTYDFIVPRWHQSPPTSVWVTATFGPTLTRCSQISRPYYTSRDSFFLFAFSSFVYTFPAFSKLRSYAALLSLDSSFLSSNLFVGHPANRWSLSFHRLILWLVCLFDCDSKRPKRYTDELITVLTTSLFFASDTPVRVPSNPRLHAFSSFFIWFLFLLSTFILTFRYLYETFEPTIRCLLICLSNLWYYLSSFGLVGITDLIFSLLFF